MMRERGKPANDASPRRVARSRGRGSMVAGVNRQVLLKSRPEGAPSLDNFELTQAPMPEPGEGEVLMRNLYLSLDPYMRGRMSAEKSYTAHADIGRAMV